jgi:hypothetical protein
VTETKAGSDRRIEPIYTGPRYIKFRHINPRYINLVTFALIHEFADA